MSRVGKKEILVDSSVKFDIKDGIFSCQGKNGKLSVKMPKGIGIKSENGKIVLTTIEPNQNQTKYKLRLIEKQNSASWGTIRQLINNSVVGVSKGFNKILILEGVGFRAAAAGRKLNLTIGYSHPVEYQLPEGINATVDNNTRITISGCDKQLIGKVAAEIRSFREPEPYKGKGIRYETEVVRRKAGKTGKK